MRVSPALNEMKLDFHLARARWNPGFIPFWRFRGMRTAVLVVPA